MDLRSRECNHMEDAAQDLSNFDSLARNNALPRQELRRLGQPQQSSIGYWQPS